MRDECGGIGGVTAAFETGVHFPQHCVSMSPQVSAARQAAYGQNSLLIIRASGGPDEGMSRPTVRFIAKAAVSCAK